MTGAAGPNRAKQQRYARAHERLQLALEYGFYIEAAMICESIISDRLHSHLHWRIELMGLSTLDEVLDRLAGMKMFRGRRPELSLTKSSTLFALIKAVELDFTDLGKPHYQGLPQRLDDWRGLRNRITHNITYTRPSRKTYEEAFEAFMAAARTCALEGQALTGQLTNWDRAVRRWHEGAARRRTAGGLEPG